jgi:hypothetical protein
LFTVIGIAIAALFPDIRQLLAAAAGLFVSAIGYLGIGDGTQEIGGQLEELVGYIDSQATNGQATYGKIYIVAYSFGSILALNSLFPVGNEPSLRLNNVDTLVTIGCPFDLIRLYWPHYFEERWVRASKSLRWTNIYAPVDILGSNFRNDQTITESDRSIKLSDRCKGRKTPTPDNVAYQRGVSPKDLSVIDILTLVGLRTHTTYWKADYKCEESCFSDVIAELYPGGHTQLLS